MVKFYVCKHKCGSVVAKLNGKGCNPSCCGEAMDEIVANTVDAAREKHVPAVTVSGKAVHVEVGSVAHPMMDVHYIEWVYCETNLGGSFRFFKPEDAPKADFALAEGEELVAVYSYCNLHGLWKAE